MVYLNNKWSGKCGHPTVFNQMEEQSFEAHINKLAEFYLKITDLDLCIA